MKDFFRQSMSWLHTWAGLSVGWVLYFVFLTGTLGYFDTEIDRWMHPEWPLVTENGGTVEQNVALGLRYLERSAPGGERWFISVPAGRDEPYLRVFYRQAPDANGNPGKSKSEQLDSQGAPIPQRASGGGQVLYRMHYVLHYMPRNAAIWIVGACSMFMLLAIVTGVIIHKRIFKDFFTFRPGKRQRSWLDAHNVLSVVALPFHFMITYSGLMFFATSYVPAVVAASYGTGEQAREVFFDELAARHAEPARAGVAVPLTPLQPILNEAARRWGRDQVRFVDISSPGDASARVAVGRAMTAPLHNSERLVFDGVSGELLAAESPLANAPGAFREVLLGLHEGLFAGPLLRWLYFISGMLGTAMIGTGLIVWTSARRRRQNQATPHAGLVLVERLNVGTVLGLPIGIAAYFWANRVIAGDFAARTSWEVNAMFITWGAMVAHAHVRPPKRAWSEQLWLGAAAYLMLPVLNALTTERHLGVSIAHGDWALAGIDLTMLLVGSAFAAVAYMARERERIAPGAGSSRLVDLPSALPSENG